MDFDCVLAVMSADNLVTGGWITAYQDPQTRFEWRPGLRHVDIERNAPAQACQSAEKSGGRKRSGNSVG